MKTIYYLIVMIAIVLIITVVYMLSPSRKQEGYENQRQLNCSLMGIYGDCSGDCKLVNGECVKK
jgi:hypothetical protein